MIHSVTVKNYLNEEKKIVLANPEETGFAITSIDGLGPVKSSVNISSVATMDGGIFNSALVDVRNIVIGMRFLGSPSVEDVRQETYRYFPVKKLVTLTIETDNRTLQTSGYVESNAPNIFSSEEDTQISILCPDPYFYSAGSNYLNEIRFGGVTSLFEFPFSNESLYDEKLEFGEVNKIEPLSLMYNGDADIGVYITIHALGPAKNIAIFDIDGNKEMKLDTSKIEKIAGGALKAGDDILINTMVGQKSIYLYRDGKYINILNALGKDITWLYLTKGDNIFAFSAEAGSSNLEILIQGKVIYEGV